MRIPYRFNPMGYEADAGVLCERGTSGVFVFHRNSQCVQSGRVVSSKFMQGKSISRMEVYSGGTGMNITAQGANVTVASGGTVLNAEINDYSYADVSSGGTFLGAEVNGSGRIYLSGGALLSGATINRGGSISLYDGARVSALTVSSYGRVYASGTGNVFDGVTIFQGGYLYAGTSSLVRNAELMRHASIDCGSGQRLEHATIHSGAVLSMGSGCTCTGLVRESGGMLSVGVWGEDSTTLLEGTAPEGGFLISGGTVNGLHVCSGDNVSVWYYGRASGCAVESYGVMAVWFGAITEDASVRTGGRLMVYSRGTALRPVVSSDGTVGGDANARLMNATVLFGGFASCNYGGTFCGRVESGGYLYLANGASAYAVDLGGTLQAYSYCVLTDISVRSGGSAYLEGNGTLGNLVIDAGGACNLNRGMGGTGVTAGGWFTVGSFCMVSDATVVNGGSLVCSGSYAELDRCSVQAGGVLSVGYMAQGRNIDVQAAGTLVIGDYGTANGCRLAGVLSLGDGASAVNLSPVSGAAVNLDRYGRLSGFTVGDGVALSVGSYAVASAIAVEANGTLSVGYSGTALEVTSKEGAIINVDEYGHIEYAAAAPAP